MCLTRTVLARRERIVLARAIPLERARPLSWNYLWPKETDKLRPTVINWFCLRSGCRDQLRPIALVPDRSREDPGLSRIIMDGRLELPGLVLSRTA
jgi:hypothetical protein